MAETVIRSEFHLTERAVGGTTVVELRGEIDILTALSLAARLDDLTAVVCPDLVVDLRSVSFIDCAGLGLLCRARNRAMERHGRLRLVTEGSRFLRVLHGAGLDGVFERYDRLSEALAAVPAGGLAVAAG
ncbi:anti-sigma factor antagonist [Streptomyces pluripotens]|uniref:Anti-sigma factor antagonist n=1 Tax=Streptomyces pluripotens TaxID=1355015 RepID=A0A221P5T5_9ACTN|nr:MULTISPECIES: STAS domain-containing protein [Streptomyces]ARP73370.1 sulfate transporter [Streptomyces pluripotens]ASN27619.1 anti-sigma factor antagonist [Streptomyces pluripotens]MCH0560298.1 STAS domain-containing protein [Streptomyces sp. MUM 16J]